MWGAGCDSPKVTQQGRLSLQARLTPAAWMGLEQSPFSVPCPCPHNPERALGWDPGKKGVLGPALEGVTHF